MNGFLRSGLPRGILLRRTEGIQPGSIDDYLCQSVCVRGKNKETFQRIRVLAKNAIEKVYKAICLELIYICHRPTRTFTDRSFLFRRTTLSEEKQSSLTRKLAISSNKPIIVEIYYLPEYYLGMIKVARRA